MTYCPLSALKEVKMDKSLTNFLMDIIFLCKLSEETLLYIFQPEYILLVCDD